MNGHPAYDTNRGPANVFPTRVHWQFQSLGCGLCLYDVGRSQLTILVARLDLDRGMVNAEATEQFGVYLREEAPTGMPSGNDKVTG